MSQTTDTSAVALLACEDGFDPIEDRLRANSRWLIPSLRASLTFLKSSAV